MDCTLGIGIICYLCSLVMVEMKILVFDLDGTLCPSKIKIDKEMAELLTDLSHYYKIAIITGGDISRIDKQVISSLSSDFDMNQLSMFPVNGTRQYKVVYTENFREEEKEKIKEALMKSSKVIDIPAPCGELIEDRGSQITFSALGQDAPLELKAKWDKDTSKRKKILRKLVKLLPGFECRIGGTTSIDVMPKGRNKSFAIKQLIGMGFAREDILFMGDSLFIGGNDYPVKEMGIECISVKDTEATKKFLRRLLKYHHFKEDRDEFIYKSINSYPNV